MRIQILSPSLGGGGAERLVTLYARGLAARGHGVAVAFGSSERLRPVLADAGVPTVRISDAPLRARSLPAWVLGLRRALAERPADVVHAQSVTAALVARLAAPGLPILVTLHGIRERHELLAALVFRGTGARVTAVSSVGADGIRRFAFAPPVEVLPPAVDVPAGPPPAGLPGLPGRPRFCCVARHDPAKGVDVLLRAFVDVRRELPEAELTLAGGGLELERNRELAAALGLAGCVHFLGFVPDAVDRLRGADVAVLPSRREGLPLAALEALAAERPLVATDVGGTGQVVVDGSTGWLVPPEDAGALARALVAAASDPAEAARRARRGRELVVERYSAERTVDRLEHELEQAIAARPRRRPRRAVSGPRAL